MYPMTITIHNQEQFAIVQRALGYAEQKAIVAEPATTKPEAKKPEASKAATAPTVAAPVSSEAPKAAEANTSTELKYDDLKGPFLQLVAKNRQAALDILKEYGAAKLTDVAQDKWAECLGKTNGAMGV